MVNSDAIPLDIWNKYYITDFFGKSIGNSKNPKVIAENGQSFVYFSSFINLNSRAIYFSEASVNLLHSNCIFNQINLNSYGAAVYFLDSKSGFIVERRHCTVNCSVSGINQGLHSYISLGTKKSSINEESCIQGCGKYGNGNGALAYSGASYNVFLSNLNVSKIACQSRSGVFIDDYKDNIKYYFLTMTDNSVKETQTIRFESAKSSVSFSNFINNSHAKEFCYLHQGDLNFDQCYFVSLTNLYTFLLFNNVLCSNCYFDNLTVSGDYKVISVIPKRDNFYSLEHLSTFLCDAEFPLTNHFTKDKRTFCADMRVNARNYLSLIFVIIIM